MTSSEGLGMQQATSCRTARVLMKPQSRMPSPRVAGQGDLVATKVTLTRARDGALAVEATPLSLARRERNRRSGARSTART